MHKSHASADRFHNRNPPLEILIPDHIFYFTCNWTHITCLTYVWHVSILFLEITLNLDIVEVVPLFLCERVWIVSDWYSLPLECPFFLWGWKYTELVIFMFSSWSYIWNWDFWWSISVFVFYFCLLACFFFPIKLSIVSIFTMMTWPLNVPLEVRCCNL